MVNIQNERIREDRNNQKLKMRMDALQKHRCFGNGYQSQIVSTRAWIPKQTRKCSKKRDPTHLCIQQRTHSVFNIHGGDGDGCFLFYHQIRFKLFGSSSWSLLIRCHLEMMRPSDELGLSPILIIECTIYSVMNH